MQKMRKSLVGIIAITAMLGGCMSIQTNEDETLIPGASIIEKLQTIKIIGCNAMPEIERRLLVHIISSQVSDYPSNGICNPVWIEQEILKQLDKRGVTTNTTLWLKSNPLVDLTPDVTDLNYAA
jgi:hypothetical protein